MISRICAELGGSFIIASGDAALKVDKNGMKTYPKPCHLQGTAFVSVYVYLVWGIMKMSREKF